MSPFLLSRSSGDRLKSVPNSRVVARDARGARRRKSIIARRTNGFGTKPEREVFLAALEPGATFPEIALETESGARFVPPHTETLYGFFKTTCPTSELSWPHFDRIRRIGQRGLPAFAVSQDDREETSRFYEKLGLEPDTLYDPPPWKASAALGLTNVPTFFLVGSHGRIRETVVGFQRPRLEGLARRAATLSGLPPVRLFRIGDVIPLIVPG